MIEKTNKRGTIKFINEGIKCKKRAERLYTSEPQTISWIDTFKSNSVFWDIGANIGCYSLYAALDKSLKVLSFEPAFLNYYVLNQNIEINKMNNIFAYCLALTNKVLLDILYIKKFVLGCGNNSFQKPVDFAGRKFDFSFKQGIMGFSIDRFIELFDPPFPNYIKIDVDGVEPEIIKGAFKTLRDERLKSILVELNKSSEFNKKEVMKEIKDAGFFLSSKEQTAFYASKQIKKKNILYNYIFSRK
jgi:FkbM family methyltransferase